MGYWLESRIYGNFKIIIIIMKCITDSKIQFMEV